MGDSSSAAQSDSSEPDPPGTRLELISIAKDGDLILDVTFENSKETLRAAREAQAKLPSREPRAAPKARVRLAFRVRMAALKSTSKYFDKLLGGGGGGGGGGHFKEARDVASALAALAARGVAPGAAAAADLPWVAIRDDDQATRYAHREGVFADLLRVLHGGEAAAMQQRATMPYVTTLAVLADRFDCTAPVARYLAVRLKFKWPVTNRKYASFAAVAAAVDEPAATSRATEEVLRQKILVSWLMNQPARFQAATREIIMDGSCRWSPFSQDDDAPDATWWYLQDGLEEELQYRRHCILNTVGSVTRHFLRLYASRERQCTLGYDSSEACDSYQLGEMYKFLAHRRLLAAVDFSPASLDAVADPAQLPVAAILAALRQCPAYQVNKNHYNCGLRTRLLPILDFLLALLSAASVSPPRAAWESDRAAAAWRPPPGRDREPAPFRFTRSLAADQRLRFEHALGTDKFARKVFTASSWDWTAE
ncbi:hypothetical protein GGS23DRAFT_538183 [Durotheca rogersii]|uniref:uncharacterized protein n=1 Tax=Durotheca rogersii TaxID=419775 RepID=UPI0022203C87|nr:uncharacterized protein GGS23DRAFT_538183 [Durotheca rogersii]KAI5863526.1 hypothetical protein GGS23DRAFT_538183 [Durotheca rogersii]